MASITETTRHAARPFAGLFDAIVRRAERLNDELGHRAEIERLSRLSDRQLADIGLSRDTIPQRAFASLYHI